MSLEFMIEMAWKSALIAGVALLLVMVLRSRAAADRAAVLRVAVALLLLLPFLSVGLPKLEIEAWAPEEIPAAAAPAASYAMPEASSAAMLPMAPVAAPTIWDDPTLLFLILYLGGVAMLAARLGTGLWMLGRWTRGSRDVDCPEWLKAFERARWSAGAPRRLRLLVSDEAPSPLSWGLLNPVILIDRDTLDQPDDADAILAHEIAHVVRRDWLVLMLTRIAAALFWFNPLVWVLEREVVQQAEEAADIEAALWVEPARYAQTLVHWAQFNAGALVPANSIAPSASALARRVRAILDARRRATPTGSVWTLAAIAGCALFAVALTVVQLIPAVAEAHVPPLAQVAAAPVAPDAPATIAGVPAPPAPPVLPDMIVTGLAPQAPEAPAGAPAAPIAPVAFAALHPHGPPPPPGAWPAAPTPPDIRVQVDGPRVRVRAPNPPRVPVNVRAPGPGGRVDADTLVALRIHGVDGAYIRSLEEASARLRRLDVDQLVALRIQGVSADYVRAMAAAGQANLDADTLVAMRVHGVSARDARQAARSRGRRVSAEELIDRAIHGDDDD